MFKAAYKTEFYRAVRDALHAEVDSWSESQMTAESRTQIDSLWRLVDELEPVSRDTEAMEAIDILASPVSSALVSIELQRPRKEA